MNKPETIFRSIIQECKKHLSRIDYAYNKLAPLLPFSGENVTELKNEEIESLDQYIFRFSKLQQTMGQKLFKAALSLLGEDVYDKSFLDIFNRLEQLGIITDYEKWNEIREIRNEAMHEYQENSGELADKLNKLMKSKENLKKYLMDILGYFENRGYNF